MFETSDPIGKIIFANSKLVHGWALALDAPFAPAEIRASFRGEPAPVVRADRPVRFFDQAGSLPNPRCGFVVPVPADLVRDGEGVRVEVEATVGGRSAMLRGSPCVVDPRFASGRSGSVDHMRGTVLLGWARDADHPGRRPAIEVRLGDRVLGTCRPGRFRGDLYLYGLEDGCFGFEIDLGTHGGLLVGAELRVCFPDGKELDGSPVYPYQGIGTPWSDNLFASRAVGRRGGRPIVLGRNLVLG